MSPPESRHPFPESRAASTSTPTRLEPRVPWGWRPGPFDYQRLDAFAVARQALARGDALARALPRGYASLADQLRRALLSAYLGVAEAASRSGATLAARFRCARGEASEAAAALEAVALLRLAPIAEVDPIVGLLGRLCAMLTRLCLPASRRQLP
jgi:four helix bundle protein